MPAILRVRLASLNMVRVLYIVGSCLLRNTSANLSHCAYVQGFIDQGCRVDVLMASDSFGEQDHSLVEFAPNDLVAFETAAPLDRLRDLVKHFLPVSPPSIATAGHAPGSLPVSSGRSVTLPAVSRRIRAGLRRAHSELLRMTRGPYPLSAPWIRRASRFRSAEAFDLVVSNSSPASGHRVAEILRDSGRVRAAKWLQIWEDPWYADVYGGGDVRIREEERRLLGAADAILYVSPLTLEYQRRLFPEAAPQMHLVDLPWLPGLRSDSGRSPGSVPCLGYFGDYYSHTRNLDPFHRALRNRGVPALIVGASDSPLPPSPAIEVHDRTTRDRLAALEGRATVLVAVCNLRGGQIPGKIYHYSATDRPVLVILDGAESEQAVIRSHLERFGRFDFCRNHPESIGEAIDRYKTGSLPLVRPPLDELSPKSVVGRLLREHGP